MIINNLYLREFKTLIQKEQKNNMSITGRITKIEKESIHIITDNTQNLSKNTPIEINRIPSTINKIKGNVLIIQTHSRHNFKTNNEVKIKNIQQDIILQKLQQTYDNIIGNNITDDNMKTLNTIFNNITQQYDNKKITGINNLNKNQQEAVQKSIQCDTFHLIQGPPGTGKTHTIIEIIRQLHSNNKRILITAHTHIALDNIIERLDFIKDDEILRNGQDDKISENTLKYTLKHKTKIHPDYQEIIKKQKLIKKLSKKETYHCTNISGEYSEENKLVKIIKSIFQIKNTDNNHSNYQSYNNNVSNNEKINQLKEEIDNIEKNIKSDILSKVKIHASTVISSSNHLTQNITFDYIIMDEASQVPVYLSLIPLMKTKKFILIGDNKQLQPIYNNNASYTLNQSIFNTLIKKYPDYYTFLNIQYRMNKEISDIASKLYYNNKLKTNKKNSKQKIKLKNNKSIFLDEEAVTLIDTSKTELNEENTINGCCNKYESEIIINIINQLINNDIPDNEIGIITPYRKQKVYIKKLLKLEKLNIECDTIYRFQGREKDVIIVSFCKSSEKALTKFQENFIANENQLNVSITRSRKKLILLGNFDMIRMAGNINSLYKEISRENIIYLQDVM